MATNIFGNTEPELTNLNDEQNYTLGTRFYRTNDGIISRGRWRFPDTLPSGPVPFTLYNFNTQSILARTTFISPTAGTWNSVILTQVVEEETVPNPITYEANTHLVAAIFTPDRYVATVEFFLGGDYINDDIVAPGDSGETRNNGYLEVVDQFPGIVSGNSVCYFPDVEFDTEEIPIEDSEILDIVETGDSSATITNDEGTTFVESFALSANQESTDSIEILDNFTIIVNTISSDFINVEETETLSVTINVVDVLNINITDPYISASLSVTEAITIAEISDLLLNLFSSDQLTVEENQLVGIGIFSNESLSVVDQFFNQASLVGQDGINVSDIGILNQDTSDVNAEESLTVVEDEFVYRKLSTMIRSGSSPIVIKTGTQTIIIKPSL